VTTWIALHLLFYPLEEKKNCNEIALHLLFYPLEEKKNCNEVAERRTA
jgi:hypothetical protein